MVSVSYVSGLSCFLEVSVVFVVPGKLWQDVADLKQFEDISPHYTDRYS